jgi:anti-sigma-K factor RskA
VSVSEHVAGEPQREALAAYALGSLEEREAEELALHLESCEACRNYLQWLRPAVDTLPASVEQLRPSPAVRQAILAEVNADARASASPTPARPRNARVGWRGLLLRPATGFAATALALAGIAGYLINGSGGGTAHSTVAAVATGPLAPAAASAHLDRVDGSGTLVVDRLPRLPRNRVYEVWVQRGGTVSPESTFVLRRDGTANAAVPGPLDGANAVLVTQEPHGGSDTPTGPVLLRAQLG